MTLPELEDQVWFPQFLRQMQMEFIGFVVSTFGTYRPILPLLQQQLHTEGSGKIFDCCSGTGGPMAFLKKHLPTSTNIVLSDLYPQLTSLLPTNIVYNPLSFNVLEHELPAAGLLTMCNAFHHFDAQQQANLLQKIAKNGRPVVIVEILQPQLWCALVILFTTTFGQLLTAIWIKPFRWSRLLFTYVLPINLITISWDGLASVGKSLRFKRLQQLCSLHSTTSYQFTCCRLGSILSPLYVLSGTPITT